MTNLLASGIQILTGQETSLRLSLRCSVKACIIHISLTIVTPIIGSIGNVKVDRLVDLGKVWPLCEKLFRYLNSAAFVHVLSDVEVARMAGSEQQTWKGLTEERTLE
jgi:hypothetical protein